MRPNKIKQMWRDGKCATMGWLSLSHGFTAEVMARQGFDALCVDLQHGTTEMNDAWPMLQAISQTDTVPFLRVAWNEPAPIMRALDLGAYGIIVPLVNTAEEAAMAVAMVSKRSATVSTTSGRRFSNWVDRSMIAMPVDFAMVVGFSPSTME